MIFMEDYTCFSDERLQKLSADGDQAAENVLAARYSDLAESCARPYFLAGAENSDLRQEAMVGLLSAIREYDPTQQVPFKAYAEICIRRQIFTAIRSASRMKHTPLNSGVSLDEMLTRQSLETGTRMNLDQRRSPEEQVLARESEREFFQSFSRCLSTFEKTVLPLYLDGFSYRSIAEKLGREEKAVDNAVQRIRRKLARIILSGDISES